MNHKASAHPAPQPAKAPRLGWLWIPPVELREAPVGMAIARQATMTQQTPGHWECAACRGTFIDMTRHPCTS